MIKFLIFLRQIIEAYDSLSQKFCVCFANGFPNNLRSYDISKKILRDRNLQIAGGSDIRSYVARRYPNAFVANRRRGYRRNISEYIHTAASLRRPRRSLGN